MATMRVAPELFSYIMERVSGEKFESFAKAVFAVEYGEQFTPLGGIHDGGADGIISSFIQQGTKPGNFVQFSVTEVSRAQGKIQETIDALRKVGRDPKQLLYCTSEAIPKQDTIQQSVFDDYGVLTTIRDRERIRGIVNSKSDASKAFYEHFATEISSIVRVNSDLTGAVNEFVADPTIFVFLNHELRDRSTKHQLLVKVTDALIYWALRDTDPDTDPKKLMTAAEIFAAIEGVFPTATNLIHPLLDGRLGELSKRSAAGTERLRFYRDPGAYCLPFHMRSELAAESAVVLIEQETFRASILQRISEASEGGLDAKQLSAVEGVVFDTVHRHFVEQGLLLAAFLEKRVENLLRDQVVEEEMLRVVSDRKLAKFSPGMLGVGLAALRGIFYSPSDDERRYLLYLSRTSLLCTTLNVSPRLLEYFNKMAGNFRLFVGTDILVKAISETYLEPSQRQVTNTLKMMAQVGTQLLLSQTAVEELFNHFHGVDLEFRNHYQDREQYLKEADISECNRILIRAYLYAKHKPKGPKTWPEFVNKFVDSAEVRRKSEKGIQQLQALLVATFKMTFVSYEEIARGVDMERVTELAHRLDEARPNKHPELSHNDALMALSIFVQRLRQNESATYDGFGIRTWWLTKETHVLTLTSDPVKKHGVPHIMRPEFLLNFITLAPKASEVREKYAALLPTTAGLQMGQHLDPSVMHQLLSDAAEWAGQAPERVGVMMSERVDRLRHDRIKQYAINLN